MIAKLLHSIGSALYGVFGSIHDAILGISPDPDMPSVLTAEQMTQSAELIGPTEPVQVGSFKDTVSYYIGGTLVVVSLAAFLICKYLPMKKKPVRRRRTTTRRRRTYRRKK